MLVFLAVCVVALGVLGLGFYAVRKMKPDAFRLRTTLWRVFSFSVEIESSSATRRLADVPGHGQGLASGGNGAAGSELAESRPPPGE